MIKDAINIRKPMFLLRMKKWQSNNFAKSERYFYIYVQNKVQRLLFNFTKQDNMWFDPLQRLARGWYDNITNLTYLPECHLR